MPRKPRKRHAPPLRPIPEEELEAMRRRFAEALEKGLLRPIREEELKALFRSVTEEDLRDLVRPLTEEETD